MRLCTTLFAAVAFTMLVREAHADSRSDAARLFKEGQELMKSQKFADACPKFEDSEKLDPQLGTALNLAFCREKLGSTWLSWLAYRDAELRADAAGKRERADFARQHLAELERTLPKLTLACGADTVDALVVEERAVPGANNGQPFTAEPGRRTFKFLKAGKRPGSEEILVEKRGALQRVPCPTLVDEPVASPVEGATNAEPQSGEPPAAPSPATSQSRAPMYIAYGVGAAGIAVGSIFGIMMFGAQSDADPHCPQKKCDATGEQKIDAARTDGWVATGGFAVGIAGAALGTYLLVTTPKERSDASPRAHLVPFVGPRAAGAALMSTF